MFYFKNEEYLSAFFEFNFEIEHYTYLPRHYVLFDIKYDSIRGRREDGRLGLAKKSKTPFFKRYFKILSRGYSNGSRTSPIFFFLIYLNKYDRYRHPKFWPKWAMAVRLIEQWPKFSSQICTNMWWTNAENFKQISQLISDLEPND